MTVQILNSRFPQVTVWTFFIFSQGGVAVAQGGLLLPSGGVEKISDRSYSPLSTLDVVAWLSGSALVLINEVTLRRARLVLGWVTVYGRVNHLGL